jgi:hypothetical protein
MKTILEVLTAQELIRLMVTKSESEWSEVCDAIKEARGGAYPDDWFELMLASGLMRSIQQSWGTPR